MKEEHYVCEGCGECFEDNFTEYELHQEECSWLDKNIPKVDKHENDNLK